MSRHTPILLIGPQHVGKSTVGKMLAYNSNLTFYDLDYCILQTYIHSLPEGNTPPPASIRELYATIEEPVFRELEFQQFSLLESPFVCATGGGIADNTQFWHYIQNNKIEKNYKIVLLESHPDIVWQRILPKGIPAYLQDNTHSDNQHDDLNVYFEKFKKIFENRMKIYSAYANIQINTIDKTPELITQEIIQTIKQ